MRKFISKFLLYAIAAFGLALAMDVTVCSGLLKMEDYRFQDYAAMLEGGMENDILIMGNSRGKSHYDTAIVDSLGNASSFCIGVGGYPLTVQLLKYHLYTEHNRKPSVIIQDIDLGCFNGVTDVRHQHQSEQFFPLIYDPLMRRELKSVGYGFPELSIPMYRIYGYQQVIKNGLLESLHLKHYVSFPAYKGHRPEEGEWNGTELKRMEPFEAELRNGSKSLFEDYLTGCKNDSIRMILVYSPMYSGAREKISGLDKVRSYFDETARRYGFEYLDYLDSPICKDTNNFCVSVHMNPQATEQFTIQLMNDINDLL